VSDTVTGETTQGILCAEDAAYVDTVK
jgi:hypothetical protein